MRVQGSRSRGFSWWPVRSPASGTELPGSRRRRSRALLALGLAALTLAGTPLPPAAAEPFGPAEALTTSVVTRLTLDADGVGWLTVHPRFYSTAYTGFDVSIPAGDGAWSGPAHVPVPELGTGCVRDPGPDLHYRCGRTRTEDPPERMPVGGYQVSFRVRHTRSTVGLHGRSSVYAVAGHNDDWSQEYIGNRNEDTFPVHRSGHRSTAEVRMVPVDWLDSSHNLAEVVASVTVVPGESVTALDLDLGRYQWRGTASNAARHGIQCFVRRVAVPSLHCKPAPGRSAFPAGQFQLVLDLDYSTTLTSPYFHWSSDSRSAVAMTVDGRSTTVDDFYWVNRVLY